MLRMSVRERRALDVYKRQVLMVLGALLGLLVLCLVMPARLRVVLKQGQWRLWAGMGPVMITLWPRKQKKKKRFRQNKKEQDQQEPAAAKAEKPAVKPEEPAASAPVVQLSLIHI